MKKLLALVSAVGMVAMMSGCGLNDPVSAPTISIDAIGSIAIASNDVSVPVTGKIEADTAIEKIEAVVTTSAGASVPSTQIKVTTPVPNGATSQNLTTSSGIVLVVQPVAQQGDYKLKITVMAGVEGSGTFNFTLTGSGGTPIKDTTLTLGAQSAAPHSLLDADAMVTYSTSVSSETDRAKIDVIFSYSTVGTVDALRFTAPSVAQGTPYTTWTNKAASEFKIVTADASTITKQEQIDALWGTGAGDTRVDVTTNGVIVIKTSEGKYKLVKITTINGSAATATIDILGKY
jgi:hypothetical protein